VYILLLNSGVKSPAKSYMRCWNINKSHRRLLFMVTLYNIVQVGQKSGGWSSLQ